MNVVVSLDYELLDLVNNWAEEYHNSKAFYPYVR